MERKPKVTITAHLDLITSGDCRIKVIANSTIVHTRNKAHYNAVIRNLQSKRTEYHSFTVGKRNHAFVVQEDQTVEAISKDLSDNTEVKHM